MDENIRSGWDVAAQIKVDHGGLALSEARDEVIIRYLIDGDTRPFSDWVRLGHMPSKWVLVALAEMMEPRRGTIEALPFALVRKKRGGGKDNSRPDPEIETRDALFADYVKARRDEGMKYDAAIAEVRELITREGGTIDAKTIRNAYDARYGKGTFQQK